MLVIPYNRRWKVYGSFESPDKISIIFKKMKISGHVFRNKNFKFLKKSNVEKVCAAEVLVLLDIRGVGAHKTFLQNGLQASVCALAKSSNNTGHVLDILPQVLNNLCQVFLKVETKKYLRVVEDIEKCPSPGT